MGEFQLGDGLERARRAISRRFLIAAAAAAVFAPSAVHGQEEAANTDYRMGSGDQLRITVFDEETLTGQYVVNSQGRVAFPLVGDVEASGKTLTEFTETLSLALERYLVLPRVSVEITNYRPFFILGEVRNPGTYPYASNLTVMNAVATAGGFTYRANTRRVWIKHVDETDERAYRLDNVIAVRPGDTVRIAERIF